MSDTPRPDAIPWRQISYALLLRDARPTALLDANSRALDVNAGFEELTGYKGAALRGKLLDELGSVDASRGSLRATLPTVLEDGAGSVEWTMRSGAGRPLTLVLALSAVADTEVIVASVTRWSTDNHDLQPLGGHEMEIAVDPFGTILRAQRPNADGFTVGEPCYKAIHGLTEPCQGCPAQPPPPPGQVREQVLFFPGRGCMIVSALRLCSDIIRVNSKHVDDALSSKIAAAKLEERGLRAKLTEREQQVLELIALGRAPLELSQELGISLSTAKFHAHNVLRKVGAESRADLLRALFLAQPRRPTTRPGPRAGSVRGKARTQRTRA